MLSQHPHPFSIQAFLWSPPLHQRGAERSKEAQGVEQPPYKKHSGSRPAAMRAYRSADFCSTSLVWTTLRLERRGAQKLKERANALRQECREESPRGVAATARFPTICRPKIVGVDSAIMQLPWSVSRREKGDVRWLKCSRAAAVASPFPFTGECV